MSGRTIMRTVMVCSSRSVGLSNAADAVPTEAIARTGPPSVTTLPRAAFGRASDLVALGGYPPCPRTGFEPAPGSARPNIHGAQLRAGASRIRYLARASVRGARQEALRAWALLRPVVQLSEVY